jgi:hypothetical protein
MGWYLLEFTLYGSSAVLYAVRSVHGYCTSHLLHFQLPESLAPGVLDIWGSSHQSFNIAILGALCTHAASLAQALESSHNMDFCEIQADRLQKY